LGTPTIDVRERIPIQAAMTDRSRGQGMEAVEQQLTSVQPHVA
jgi:hypothetical protein